MINPLESGCPVLEGVNKQFCVRYCVRRAFNESALIQYAHSSIVSFDNADDRDAWVSWHTEHTANFVLIKQWEHIELSEEEKAAQHARQAANAERVHLAKMARAYKFNKWAHISATRYIASKHTK